MHIRTDIHAGDIMDDVASGIKRTGNYLAQLVDEADSQATKLANDVMFFSTSLVDCLNTTIRSRRDR